MTEAKKILSLIESLTPYTEKEIYRDKLDILDEIDARVVCYVNTTYEQTFVGLIKRTHRYGDGFEFTTDGQLRDHNLTIRYTRSRDALKSIRPEGCWRMHIEVTPNGESVCELEREEDDGKDFKIISIQATEELTELHAIIQAIEWERNN